MKKRFIIIYLFLLLCPISIFAYSDKIIVGGDTLGIEVFSDGIYVVGFYKVDNNYIGKDAGFMVGDIIQKINGVKVDSITMLNENIVSNDIYNFEVLRNNKKKNISLKIEEEGNTFKTGLFVKDRINGIGTLSYIDPKTKIFGSLGHEILESSSLQKFQITDGNIYKAEVTSIKKSEKGITGEKNAKIYSDRYGDVFLNEDVGIFGMYDDDTSEMEEMVVGNSSEIHKGEAYIRTVIEGENVELFSIDIISIDESSSTKNILFEVTDKRLLDKTGGIVQGMSGSPIIQNNKVIGVVNYVIVEDSKMGYGVFITTMLEEGDKILS